MQTRLTVVLLALILGGIAFCMTFLMEQYETEIWTGPSAEAARNPFLAAERFLTENGVEVVQTKDVVDFSQIPVDQTVMLTQVDSMLVSPRQISAAADWVKRGGYLIAGVGKVSQGEVSLLREFDVETTLLERNQFDELFNSDNDLQKPSERLRELNRKIEKEQAEQQAAAAEGLNDEETESKPKNFAHKLVNEDKFEYYPMQIDEDKSLYLAVLDKILLEHARLYEPDSDIENSNSDDYVLTTFNSDEHGTRLLQFSFGDGMMTFLSSSNMWQNQYIGLADHAYFLSELVGDDSTFHLFYNVKTPPLYQLIYQNFRFAVLWGLLLLLLWLWRSAARSRPIAPSQVVGARHFAEHLRSSAEFIAAQEDYHALLEPIKLDIEDQCRKLNSNFNNLVETKQVSLLTASSGLSQAAVESWFAYCEKIENKEQLLDAIRLGQAIRKKL